jgi:hypothetical protein
LVARFTAHSGQGRTQRAGFTSRTIGNIKMTFSYRTPITISVLAATSLATQAQSIEQFDARDVGSDRVLELQFANEIQFRRAVTTHSGDLTQIFYTLVSTTNAELRSTQGLRLGAAQGLPSLDLTDEPEKDLRTRKITVRGGQQAKLKVRAGKGNRSIEIVLEGAAVAKASPPTPTVTTAAKPASPTKPASNVAAAAAAATAAATAAVPSAVATAAAAPPPAAAAMPPVAAPVVPLTPPADASTAAAPDAAPKLLSQAEIDAQAETLFASAQAAMQRKEPAAAIPPLNQLLNLPPSKRTRDAQEMVGMARLGAGDMARARAEFETYLQLYPQGEGSERVRRELAALPAAAAPVTAVKPKSEVETTTTGSASLYYFGGNGQVRSQDFKDSPVAGVPQVAGDPLFSADKASQLFTDVDLTWRQRDDDRDMRFVFRDSYTSDLERSDKSKNRLSSLFFDYKSISGGYGVRLGRQSPLGGGVLGRFDGVSANYLVRPKVKLGVVAGVPTDKYFDSKRYFYGASLDVDGLMPNFGAAVYAIQRNIDSEVDRRALGLEMRYFKGGASVFSQFDYDTLIGGLNIATVQGTLIMDDGTVLNGLYDRRALSVLALGNSLLFADPNNPAVLFSRISDKLATTTLAALRDQIKATTPFVTQAQAGFTRPINKTWQFGGSAQLTETGPIPPVPEVVGFENGVAASGKIASLTGQLIGLNLYSPRDTHVASGTIIYSHRLKGFLMAYNNSSTIDENWQLEPSLQYYQDSSIDNTKNQRWTPGMRVSYRGFKKWALESSLTYEIGKSSRVGADPLDPTLTTTTNESSSRVNYSLGARFEF